MNAAFGVKLFKAKLDGREFRYTEDPVTLPRSVAKVVTAVLGLDDRQAGRTSMSEYSADSGTSLMQPGLALDHDIRMYG